MQASASKPKRWGIGRPYIEGRTGDSFLFKTGKWMFLERIIDRARNWYKELIIDLRRVPLSEVVESLLTDHRAPRQPQEKKPGP